MARLRIFKDELSSVLLPRYPYTATSSQPIPQGTRTRLTHCFFLMTYSSSCLEITISAYETCVRLMSSTKVGTLGMDMPCFVQMQLKLCSPMSVWIFSQAILQPFPCVLFHYVWLGARSRVTVTVAWLSHIFRYTQSRQQSSFDTLTLSESPESRSGIAPTAFAAIIYAGLSFFLVEPHLHLATLPLLSGRYSCSDYRSTCCVERIIFLFHAYAFHTSPLLAVRGTN